MLDLDSAAREAESLLGAFAGDGHRVTWRLARDAGFVRMDRVEFDRVILNLVINAFEAMPNGGSVEIATRRRVEDGAEYAVLEIADQGSGMDAATRARILEPRYTTKPDGTGLGLSTVAAMVEHNAGVLEIDSSIGIGTVVRVALPRQEPVAACEPGPLPTGSERVLVVEDEPGVREALVGHLRSLGYTVETAVDAGRAERALRRKSAAIDLLVSDVELPDADGVEMFGRVREFRPRLPALFVTGFVDSAITSQFGRGDGVAFLSKPVANDRLAQAVRDALDGRH